MDWIGKRQCIWDAVKKYRYICLAILVGILMMTVPDGTSEPAPQSEQQAEHRPDLEASLSEILGMIAGAGKVEVMLTLKEGERTIYQNDEVRNQEDLRSNTVLVTGSDRAETGLILQILPPVYRGAVIVCQGADDARVRLAIVEAVKSVTGLSSDHIAVLKMK